METTTNNYPFLAGGGEMGELTRNFDWSKTSLSTPDQWPVSLRTTLGIVLHSAFPMFLFWGNDLVCFYNDAFRPSLGVDGKHPALGKQGSEVWAEIWDFIGPMIQQVMSSGEPVFFEDQLVPFYRNGRIEDSYWTFSYSPAYDDTSHIKGVFVTCTETTKAVKGRKELEESQRQVLASFEQSPIGIAIISEDNLILKMANPFYGYLVGRKPEDIVGKPLLEAMPELAGQGFDELLWSVMATGTPYIANEVAVNMIRNNQLETIYVDLTYQPQREADSGRISGVLVVVIDVTQQVQTRKKVEESEAKQRAIIAAVPAAMVLFVGRELVVEMPSQNFIDIIDRGPDVTGKPLRALMPELESQSFLQILDAVYSSGHPYNDFGTQVDIVQQDGSITHNFFNLIYTPLFTTEGQVYAILSIATDVTDIIKARKALEEAKESLRGAIELAELAMWRLDIEKGTYWYSERFMDWLGFSENTKNLDEAYNPLPDAHRQSVANIIAVTIQPGSSGLYENEHPIINRLTGQERIIHVQGQVVYDENGKPVTLSGTVQDVTQQRQLQLALEQLVHQRTEELAVANATLAATNEEILSSNTEYAAINEELEEANDLLSRSNENLQQFAYIASHDLQEPLRKIQQFGDLLKTRFAPSSGEELVYLERMQSAASRMSTLIRDLLNFSRISTQRDTSTAVSLTTVLQTVLADLELTIQETGAQVQVDTLPTIFGDSIQLGQLFQNLLSNALKFHKPGIAPQIDVTTHLIETAELPSAIKPTRLANRYYRIDVVDNGVGFNEKYLDRIFQVFQRLYGKNEFAGTGIGLAICKKVATNHGGDITAISQLNQGSTFSVYLPAE